MAPVALSKKEKLQQSKQESSRQVLDLQAQLEEVTASREEMHNYIRELEQSNDDLERAKRTVSESAGMLEPMSLYSDSCPTIAPFARKLLIEYGKTNNLHLKLRYDKLLSGGKTFVYDQQANKVVERKS
ncbi:hypothetical protein HPB52_009244 [Rhipicephalus sanguineus]|uniref:Uncharacterized protein n=1 Tax=Rhipicephalus sanguineus TaxID=34632 RepID=A0A9D4PIY9_RHISA|nr:hypothetical protein HPB52_009244 [Rhipicephalus sanguineus]